jgi:hypothetical protein
MPYAPDRSNRNKKKSLATRSETEMDETGGGRI